MRSKAGALDKKFQAKLHLRLNEPHNVVDGSEADVMNENVRPLFIFEWFEDIVEHPVHE